MGPDLADEAYSVCLALAGPGDPTAEAAVAALRLGGWSRPSVLGHACARAALLPGAAPPGDDGPSGGGDVREAARWLAATRPPAERAVVELADRHRLSGHRLGRALGVSEADGAAALARAAGTWEAELDPALMAWLGPAACEELAALLVGEAGGSAAAAGPEAGEAGPDPAPALSARQALAVGPAVDAHSRECAACADRRRAMASVRAVLAAEPLSPAPPAVRAAAPRHRGHRPTPVPALSGAGGGWSRRRRRLLTRTVPLAALLAGGTGAVSYLAWAGGGGSTTGSGPAAGGGGDREAGASAALGRLPAGGSALALTPPTTSGRTLRLADQGSRDVFWQVTTNSPWLTVVPASGHLSPGQAVELSLSVAGGTSPGLRATVTASGADGSVAVTTFSVP